MQPRTHAENPQSLLAELTPADVLWLVDTARQSITFWQNGTCIDQQPVSTAAAGFGNTPGSHRTPLGWHRVPQIIGQNAPLGQPFRSRLPSGAPLPDWQHGTHDAILSRIVLLDGLIPGLNHHSLSRHIYIHGTNQEARLGTPCSHGCIRMANHPLARWIDRLGSTLPHVWIGTCTTLPTKILAGYRPNT